LTAAATLAALGLTAVCFASALPARAQQTPAPATPPPANPTAPVAPPPTVPAATNQQNTQAPAAPQTIQVPPPQQVAPYLPFPQLPAVALDEANNRWGFAQQTARAKNLQARMLWVDATANLDKYNSADKVKALVAQIKAAGFNAVAFDAKPISGQVNWPSKYAPRLLKFEKPGVPAQSISADFDPLKAFCDETRAQGLNLIVNFNAFSEGHQLFRSGPGYEHPEWQSVLYEERPSLKAGTDPSAPSYPVSYRANELPDDPDQIGVYTDVARITADIPKRNPTTVVVAVVDASGKVAAQIQGTAFAGLSVSLPPGGAAFVGAGQKASEFLRQNAGAGRQLALDSQAAYVRIGERPRRQVPLMTNPFRDDVRRRLLDILTEVVTTYPVDGVVFDDRLRYAGIDGDFSDEAKRAFAAYVGREVNWPDDVIRFRYDFPTMDRREIPGPLYDAWLTFRALNLRNFLAEVVRTVKGARPNVTVSTYVGSWYPDYPDVGANWAADDFTAGYRFLNESYRKTGWAGLTDFVVTGCYYKTASMAEANALGQPIGETVEAAGQFSNRAVNDQSWTYAGIALSDFKGKPDDLKKALQAAAATTQGIMVFDLSHDIEPMWPVFTQAFQKPAVPPHTVSDALADVRRQHAAKVASGVQDPPTILYRGASGTGF
jgi:uncharacterized lipoprotein YddW (UPF0748 family)